MAKTTPLVHQTAYRGRNDDGTETTATWKAAQSVNWTQRVGNVFRVRFLLEEEAGAISKNGTYDLRYQVGTGAWTSVNTTSAKIRAVTSAHVPDTTPTTQQMTGGTGTFQAGEVSADGITAAVSIAAGGQTEVEYIVTVVGADTTNGELINLRVWYGDGTALDGYTSSPQITVDKPPPLPDTSVRVSFPTPTAALEGTQTFRVRVRRTGSGGSNPTARVELWEAGVLVSTPVASTAISSTTGRVLSGTWSPTGRTAANIEARIYGTSTADARVEIGSVAWDAKVLASSGTAVGKSLQAQWDVHAPAGKTVQTVWGIRTTIGQTRQALWNVTVPVAQTRQALWSIRATASTSRQALWDVLATAGDIVQALWDVNGALTAVGKDVQALWNLYATAGAHRRALWNLRGTVGSSRQAQWNINALASSNRQALWNLAALAGAERQALWNIAVTAGANRQALWSVRASAARQVQALWDVNGALTAVGKSVQALWDARTLVADDLQALWDVNGALTAVGKSMQTLWNLHAAVTADRSVRWDLRAATAAESVLVWDALTLTGGSTATAWDIRALAGDGVAAVWEIRSVAGQHVALVWDVESQLVIITPASRIYVVDKDRRTAAVAADLRVFTVAPAENRRALIAPDPRAVVVPAEPRIVVA